MTALADALEAQNELHELTMLLLGHHATLCREERAITADDLERLLRAGALRRCGAPAIARPAGFRGERRPRERVEACSDELGAARRRQRRH
jgi:hypothetical protein